MNRTVTRARRSLAIAVGTLIGLGAGTAQAQIDEIVITARKIEENLFEVPIAVSAFSANTIDQLNLTSTDDIALFTPGFSFTPAFGRQPGSDRPSMRGISTIVNGIANASAVSYFIDGVYLGGSPQSTELANLERVEILRGPQAAQFGRGTYVGAINYVTRKPTDTLEGSVDLSAGTDNYFVGTAWVSGPVTDTLSYYLSGGFDTIDGQYTNQRTGGDVGGQETTSLTGKLLWNPTEKFDATLRLGYQTTDDQHPALYLQPRGLNNTAFRTAEAPRAREYYQGTAVPNANGVNLYTDILEQGAGFSGVKLDRFISSLTLNWEVADNVTLTSVTGWIDDEVETAFDVSYAGYVPIPFGAAAASFNQWDKDEQSDFSQEIRATFTGLEDWRFVIGGYYYKGTADEVFSRGLFVTDPANPTLLVANNTLEEVENIAVFGSVDWDITDRLTATIEARWAQDDISAKEEPQGGGPLAANNSGKFDSVTPRFTAVYSLTDELNLYGNIGKGTKPGTFNDASQCPELPINVDEEEAWNYELGLKGGLLDGRASFAVAGYFLDVTNQQLTTVCEIPGSGGVTTSGTSNVGKTEVYGIEFESTFQLTDNWTAGLTYAYTNAEIKENISIDQADLKGSLGGLEQTRLLGQTAGNKVPRIPENMFSLYTRFEGELGGENSWYAGADYAFEGSKFAQEHNLIETGDRNIVGARAGVILGSWELAIWGKNLLDDDTPIDVLRYIDRRAGTLDSCASFGTAISCTSPNTASTSPRGFALTLPRERLIGADVTYRFGGAR